MKLPHLQIAQTSIGAVIAPTTAAVIPGTATQAATQSLSATAATANIHTASAPTPTATSASPTSTSTPSKSSYNRYGPTGTTSTFVFQQPKPRRVGKGERAERADREEKRATAVQRENRAEAYVHTQKAAARPESRERVKKHEETKEVLQQKVPARTITGKPAPTVTTKVGIARTPTIPTTAATSPAVPTAVATIVSKGEGLLDGDKLTLNGQQQPVEKTAQSTEQETREKKQEKKKWGDRSLRGSSDDDGAEEEVDTRTSTKAMHQPFIQKQLQPASTASIKTPTTNQIDVKAIQKVTDMPSSRWRAQVLLHASASACLFKFCQCC